METHAPELPPITRKPERQQGLKINLHKAHVSTSNSLREAAIRKHPDRLKSAVRGPAVCVGFPSAQPPERLENEIPAQ
ncbi:hypothetical protein CRENBAI_011658 [Crenichthys baileyi]|uniref:Uncharacterized protein n=1 Tax=Crenichthys baileyi TaxID=28760 RepID=A0AAV9RU80_9TELE